MPVHAPRHVDIANLVRRAVTVCDDRPVARHRRGIDDARNDSTFWSATLGGKVGIFRYGTSDYILPDGLQFDAEASTQVRLDVPENVDVRSADYRGPSRLANSSRLSSDGCIPAPARSGIRGAALEGKESL